MNKQELRTHYKQLRAGIPAAERERIDAGICAQVQALPAYHTADMVLAYLSFGDEVDTREIINQAWRDGKHVALPRVVPGTHDMKWYRVYTLDGLEKSPLGVEEPPADPEFEVDPAQETSPLVLVPGMAFDQQGYRLGYGGGFYDAFLAGFDGPSVGLCREAALCEHLESREPHDLPVQIVATEDRALVSE